MDSEPLTSNQKLTPFEREFACILDHPIKPSDREYIDMLWDTSYRRYYRLIRLQAEIERLTRELNKAHEASWAKGPNGVLVMTERGVRMLEQAQATCDELERMINERDRLRADCARFIIANAEVAALNDRLRALLEVFIKAATEGLYPDNPRWESLVEAASEALTGTSLGRGADETSDGKDCQECADIRALIAKAEGRK